MYIFYVIGVRARTKKQYHSPHSVALTLAIVLFPRWCQRNRWIFNASLSKEDLPLFGDSNHYCTIAFDSTYKMESTNTATLNPFLSSQFSTVSSFGTISSDILRPTISLLVKLSQHTVLKDIDRKMKKKTKCCEHTVAFRSCRAIKRI